MDALRRAGVCVVGVLSAMSIAGRASTQDRQPPLTQARAPYELLDGGPVSLPFEVVRGDIRFHCQLNGRDVAMLLDDGFMWDELLLWGPAVDSLGLHYTGELPPLGRRDSLPPPPPSKLADGVRLRIPGVVFPNETAVVSPPGSWYERAFAGSVGQVSGTFLKNFVVGIDFDRMVITLWEPDRFHYSGSGHSVPWEPLGFGPWGIPVTLEFPDGRRTELPVLLDLGYNEQIQLVAGGKYKFAIPEHTLVRTIDRGVGPETFDLARLPSVDVGGYALSDVLVSFLPEQHTTLAFSEAMLGLGLLSRFNVVYDFPNRRLYLEPNRSFGRPFEFDMSGFESRRIEDGTLVITEVHPASPASEAGLLPGDRVSEVNGKAITNYDPDALRTLWRQAGATVRLRVIRGDRSMDVSLLLRRVI